MALEDRGPLLACGTPLQDLIEQIAGERPPADAAHLASCSHCEAAMATLRSAWAQLRAFADQPVAVPVALGERILSQLRSLTGQAGGPVVLQGARGSTEVGAKALSQIARGAALAVPGVALASVVQIAVDPDERSRVRLGLRLAIELGPSIDVLAALVRTQVSRRLTAYTGAEVLAVDIEFADVLS